MPSAPSFYNLDYITEKLEKRLDSLYGTYQGVMERFTNLILIYSAVAIFLIPIIQDVFWSKINHRLFISSFVIFGILLTVSLVFTVRLLIPVEIAYLDPLQKYYATYRLQYEITTENREEIDQLLKASYIHELEEAVDRNTAAFRKKSHFYYSGLTYALVSAVPYLICLGFHVAQKEDTVYKVDIVKSAKIRNFNQSSTMSDNTKNTTITTTTTASTQLPGVDNSRVIPSSPTLIKENSHTPSVRK